MSLTADKILAIDVNNPEQLFTQDGYEKEYNKLRIVWHPDKCSDPQSDKVFARIQALFKVAEKKIEHHSWETEGDLSFKAKGSKYKFKYLKMHETDIGKTYIGHEKVLFLYDSLNSDLFAKAHRTIDSIKFPNDRFKKEFDRFLPTNSYRKFDTSLGSMLLITKTPDVISLQDLLNYLPDNKLDPKHVAWIISSTMNLLCFLEHLGIYHNAITTESVYVSLQHHSVCLLGGWGFSAKNNSRIVAIPKKLKNIVPDNLFVDKRANTLYDQYGLKSMAIECLGDSTLIGSKLLMDKSIPKPFINWLRQPPTQSAKKEYSVWITTLKEAYGKRKFFKSTIDITKIYEV